VLANIPVGLPALTRADKLSKWTTQTGFDWLNIDSDTSKNPTPTFNAYPFRETETTKTKT